MSRASFRPAARSRESNGIGTAEYLIIAGVVILVLLTVFRQFRNDVEPQAGTQTSRTAQAIRGNPVGGAGTSRTGSSSGSDSSGPLPGSTTPTAKSEPTSGSSPDTRNPPATTPDTSTTGTGGTTGGGGDRGPTDAELQAAIEKLLLLPGLSESVYNSYQSALAANDYFDALGNVRQARDALRSGDKATALARMRYAGAKFSSALQVFERQRLNNEARVARSAVELTQSVVGGPQVR